MLLCHQITVNKAQRKDSKRILYSGLVSSHWCFQSECDPFNAASNPRGVIMGNFERGVEKIFQDKPIAGTKYKNHIINFIVSLIKSRNGADRASEADEKQFC